MKVLYKVTQDDTLDLIALKFNASAKEILNENKIEVNKILPGVRLVINVSKGKKYIVKPFDTIAKIAKEFDVSQQSIKQNNGIEEVFLGEMIFIPEN